MKRRFDPRGMRKAMEERNEEAKQSSEALLAEIKSGDIDPAAENFNQGAAQPEIAEWVFPVMHRNIGNSNNISITKLIAK